MIYPKRTRTRDLFELNGIWDFARELEPGAYSNGFVPEKQVAVPGSYNDLFTEEEFRMWHKGVWYQRRFEQPLQPGVEFALKERRGDWWNIELPDGNEGWIRKEAASLVQDDTKRPG